jgi:uncharacterized protein (DUF1330 family)
MSEHPGIAPAGEPITFEDCLQRVNPSAAALENLALQPDATPFVMLNLLRFRPRGDASIYSLYGREAAPEVAKTGSFVGYFGSVLHDLDASFGFDTGWDGLVLPVYRRRASFLQLQQSSRYQLAIPYRSAGTQRRTLYVLSDGDSFCDGAGSIALMDESRTGLPAEEDRITVLELLRFSSPPARDDYGSLQASVNKLLETVGAEVILSVETEIPVLSESIWDHCLITQFPNRDALAEFYISADWQEFSTRRTELLTDRLSVAAQSKGLPG